MTAFQIGKRQNGFHFDSLFLSPLYFLALTWMQIKIYPFQKNPTWKKRKKKIRKIFLPILLVTKVIWYEVTRYCRGLNPSYSKWGNIFLGRYDRIGNPIFIFLAGKIYCNGKLTSITNMLFYISIIPFTFGNVCFHEFKRKKLTGKKSLAFQHFSFYFPKNPFLNLLFGYRIPIAVLRKDFHKSLLYFSFMVLIKLYSLAYYCSRFV